MSKPRNIAVLRALGGIGDVLTAVPALARLRAANPEARITFIGLPQVEHVVKRYGDLIDRFVTFPGFPGIPEHPFNARRLHDLLEDWRIGPQPDLVLQMHGSGSVSNVFAALLAGKRTMGYFVPGLWVPNNEDYAPFPDMLSEVERWTALVAHAGCLPVEAPAFPVGLDERNALFERVPQLEKAPFAIIHAGASDPARRWPADRFAKVADELAALGLKIVLTGTAAERPITGAIVSAMRSPALDLAGRTTLGEAAALIERAMLTVTNDTGTSHLAASLGAPSIILFIASDPARWAPVNDRVHFAVGPGVADVPAGERRPRAQPSFPEIDEVMMAVERQLMTFAA